MIGLAPWAKLAGAAVIAASLAGGGMWLMARIKSGQIERLTARAEKAEGLAAARDRALLDARRADVARDARDRINQDAKDRIGQYTIKLVIGVPQIVTAEIDRTYPVPCAAVRVHDAIAHGVEPDAVSLPPGLADGDPCPVTASALVADYAWLAGEYRKALADLDTWDGWHADNAAIWNERLKEK